jgi:WD40 repeat protein
MGVVYKARQINLNRVVALKLILSGQMASTEDVQRFHAEAEAAASLDHPGIVPIFEIGQQDDQHYFSMGYIDGSSLADRIKEGPLPPREAAALTKKIADAIAYAHDKGIIHRDLKPANVLLDKDGEPRVTDFGLARKLEQDSGLTKTGVVMGTPSYMPPEQAAGKTNKVGTLSDVYSIGAILYCLLTGRPPFQAASPVDTILQVLESEPVSVRSLNSGVPHDLETICQKCLQKEPSKRYTSATELAMDLNRWLRGEPIRARAVSTTERAWRWVLRHPAPAASLVMGFFLFLLLSIGGPLVAWRQSLLRSIMERSLWRSQLLAAVLQTEKGRVNEATLILDGIQPQFRELEWYLLQRQLIGSDVTWRGYVGNVSSGEEWQGSVTQTTFSPNGEFFAVAANTANNELACVAIINASTGLEERRIPLKYQTSKSTQAGRISVLESKAIDSLCIAPDSSKLLISSLGNVSLWDVSSGQLIQHLETTSEGGVAFSPDGKMIACGVAGKIRIRDSESLELKRELPVGVTPQTIRFSQDGEKIACCGQFLSIRFGPKHLTYRYMAMEEIKREKDDWIEIHSLEALQPVVTLKGHRLAVTDLAFSSDGKMLCSSSIDGEIRIWNLERPEIVQTLVGHDSWITSVAVSGDGRMVASGSHDRTVRLWDAKSGKLIRTLYGHTETVTDVCFSPDGMRLVSASTDNTAKIWNLIGGGERLLRGHSGPVTDIVHSPDGTLLASIANRTLTIWNSASSRKMYEIEPEDRGATITCMAFKEDGTRLVAGTSNGELFVWDLSLGKKVASKIVAGPIHDLQYDSKLRIIVRRGLTGTVSVIREATLDEERFFNSAARTFCVNPSNDSTVIESLNAEMHIVSNETGESLRRFEFANQKGIGQPLTSSTASKTVKVSPDGNLLGRSIGNRIELMKLTDDRELYHLERNIRLVLGFCFDSRGRRIVAINGSNQAAIYDAQDGAELMVMQAPSEIISLSIAPNNKGLAFGHKNGTISQWDGFEGIATKEDTEYRIAKLLPDAIWHVEQARSCEDISDWYGATFHWAWAANSDEVHKQRFADAFAKLQTEYATSGKDANVYIAPIVKRLADKPK